MSSFKIDSKDTSNATCPIDQKSNSKKGKKAQTKKSIQIDEARERADMASRSKIFTSAIADRRCAGQLVMPNEEAHEGGA